MSTLPDLSAEPEWTQQIHGFWYGDQDVFDIDYQHLFDRWYRGDASFDAEVRQRFEPILVDFVTDERAGRRERWTSSARARHAVVLLCDQLPRNMYRGTAEMFAFDDIATAVVHASLDDGTYDALSPIEQLFMAVALEHSERLADVERSASLMQVIAHTAPPPQKRRFASMCRYNADHLRVVRRFGRYPHRNELLGRASTPEELAFLATASYRWMRSVRRR